LIVSSARRTAATTPSACEDDERFFAALADTGSGSDGWGSIGGGWDALSYDLAARAAPEDSEHQRLVGDLVDAFFSHLRTDAGAGNYVSLDRGLAILSRHANDLDYTAVVLFLDELILWLASHSQDQAFLNREGQKVSKLVEAGDADRPIPIVSFIARQRDLRELVGASVPGAQQLAFADVLQWWESTPRRRQKERFESTRVSSARRVSRRRARL